MDNKLNEEKVTLENSEALNQENTQSEKIEQNKSHETVAGDVKSGDSVFEKPSEGSNNEDDTNIAEEPSGTSVNESNISLSGETSVNSTNENDTNISEDNSENSTNEDDLNVTEETADKTVEAEAQTEENMIKNLFSSKGNILILLSLIISIILGIYFIFFYNNSIVGAWVVESNTGKERSVSTYLEFQKDGTVSVKKESIQVFGKYELKPDNKVNIDISIDGKEASAGEFTYTVKSDFTSRKLELVRESGKLTEYTQCKEVEKMSLKDFNGNDKILGSWVNTNYNLEYEFLDNGIAYVILPNIRISMLYTIENDYITFVQYKNNSPLDNTMQYSLDGDTLLLNGIKYNKK